MPTSFPGAPQPPVRRDPHADRHATNGPDELTPASIGAATSADAVLDGDAAGGVLGGTYPNPTFAVDMATQAELDAVAAAKQNSITGAWTPYTPDLTAATTNPTLGSGSHQYGHYIQLGRLVIATAAIHFGTSGMAGGSGAYRVSLPIATRTMDTDEIVTIGQGQIRDDSAVTRHPVTAYFISTTTVAMVTSAAGGGVIVAHNGPFTWAASDFMSLQFMYEAASG